jgi:hypothetical protein
MKWEDVLAEKTALTREVIASLSEGEKPLLTSILQAEKQNREKLKWKHADFYREQLNSKVPDQ